MIQTEHIIESFSELGNEFSRTSEAYTEGSKHRGGYSGILTSAIERSFAGNPWFIPDFVRFSFKAWAGALRPEKIARWLEAYEPLHKSERLPQTAGIVMAGNIPMVGLHDLLCVLASGNRALVKLSSSDDQLIPAIVRVLGEISPELANLVSFTGDGQLRNFDAVIATGSNNSFRYFDYYFGKYPHIIRKNRNGVAVLDGNETPGELEKLADDIFLYFGLGCRNVSKIYVPKEYRNEELFPHFYKYGFFKDMHKYRNNYDYQKSILIINGIPHQDNGFLLTREDTSMISPISVLHTEKYSDPGALPDQLKFKREEIQCVVSGLDWIPDAIPPGQAQYPELWDYADGADTMEFLLNLPKNK